MKDCLLFFCLLCYNSHRGDLYEHHTTKLQYLYSPG